MATPALWRTSLGRVTLRDPGHPPEDPRRKPGATAERREGPGTDGRHRGRVCRPRGEPGDSVSAATAPDGRGVTAPLRALSGEERTTVLDQSGSPHFVDRAPAEIYATLLDEEQYVCSIRTMYRLLDAVGEVRERRDQLRHVAPRPELLTGCSGRIGRAIQRLNPALLTDAQHQGGSDRGRRWPAAWSRTPGPAELERLDAMRLQVVRLPDPIHRRRTHSLALRQRAHAPVGRVRGCRLQGGHSDHGNASVGRLSLQAGTLIRGGPTRWFDDGGGGDRIGLVVLNNRSLHVK
jgi:hypothetical protein